MDLCRDRGGGQRPGFEIRSGLWREPCMERAGRIHRPRPLRSAVPGGPRHHGGSHQRRLELPDASLLRLPPEPPRPLPSPTDDRTAHIHDVAPLPSSGPEGPPRHGGPRPQEPRAASAARTPTSRQASRATRCRQASRSTSALGSTVTDVDGNTFIDIIGGIGVNALGHSHPKMVRAIGDQVVAASVGSFTTGARVELVERLASHAPAPGVASPPALFERRRSGGERAPSRQVSHRQVRVRELLGRLPRQDDGRALAHGLDLQGQARPDGPRLAHRPVRRLLPLPGRA